MGKREGISYPMADAEKLYHARKQGSLRGPDAPYRLMDLFCGAGGLTLGFTRSLGHSFRPVWANDFNEYACDTYNANFGGHCYRGDIVDFLENDRADIAKADVVIGGPPCQGFSLLNKNRRDDDRKRLWKPFLKMVERSGAKIFVMENVPQLLNTEEHASIVSESENMGFRVAWAKLCAADYGVPQTRWRAFIVGCNFMDPSRHFPPKRTHRKPEDMPVRDIFVSAGIPFVEPCEPWKTVRDAIHDLPAPEGTSIGKADPPLDLHFGRNPTSLSMKRYESIPEQGMNRFDLQRIAPELTPGCWKRKKSGGTDLFGRLWWDRPSVTIRTEFYKPEKGRYLHPEQHRPITHREAARLQSFPDSFMFTGSKIEIARQIGNAVPPVLAARIADSVLALLMDR
jgi:DNA (cytosine-5)-methyltransferase 1